MTQMLNRAAWARVIPFVLFIVILALRGNWPASMQSMLDPRWLYGVGVLVVAGALYLSWPQFRELASDQRRLGWSGWTLAILIGVVVFELWIHLTDPWMLLGHPTATFRPVDDDGSLLWGLIAIRWVGAALMVPVMEELFWRSFFMRWIDNPDFESVQPQTVSLKALLLSSLAFMLAHTLWLAAIIAGLLYAWLYKRTGSLWAPVVAHGVTNGILGIWVVVWGNWAFW